MPRIVTALASQLTLVESGGSVSGSSGTGVISAPVSLGVPRPPTNASDEVTPQAFEFAHHSFSTARADLSPLATNTAYSLISVSGFSRATVLNYVTRLGVHSVGRNQLSGLPT